MFNIFKNKNKHKHEFTKEIGMYYILRRSSYEHQFDEITIYQRKTCNCGKVRDFKLSTNTFKPSLFNMDNTDEKTFIELIKAHGVKEQFEINISLKKC